MFDRVVVPINPDQKPPVVVEMGGAIARRLDLPLELVSCVTSSADVPEVRYHLERCAEQTSVPTTTVVIVEIGPVATCLTEHYKGRRPLYVIPTLSPNRSEIFRGSVATALLDVHDDPVLLVGPRCQVPDGGVDAVWPDGPALICVDGSTGSETVVDPAIAFCQDLQLVPWIVSVIDASAAETISRGEANLVVAVARDHAVDGLDVNYDVLHGGNAWRAIVDDAEHRRAALIAMATTGPHGLTRVIHGSTAAHVVHDAPCPVLVMHTAPVADAEADRVGDTSSNEPATDDEARGGDDATTAGAGEQRTDRFLITLWRGSVVVHVTTAETMATARALGREYENAHDVTVEIERICSKDDRDLLAATQSMIEALHRSRRV